MKRHNLANRRKIDMLMGAMMLGAMALGAQAAVASDDTRREHGHHAHGAMHGDHKDHASMQGGMDGMANMPGMFLRKTMVDGYQVSFHVMKPKGGDMHHFMVKVEKDGKAVPLVAVNSKVTHPDGQSESKMMKKMGDWWMAAYDLGHAGEHKLMVLFKTDDGDKHFGGVRFPGMGGKTGQ